jgi:hypothetical protein
MFNRLNCMRLVLSNSTMLRRMNDFAKLHEDRLLLHKRAGAIQPHVDKLHQTPTKGKPLLLTIWTCVKMLVTCQRKTRT